MVAVSILLIVGASGPVAAGPADPTGNCPVTAAEILGWGAPTRADDFDDPAALAGWQVYDTAGHAGNGRRTPAAVDVAGGLLTITGDAAGNSGGMAWRPGQLYGRWEACVRTPPASPNYHAVVLLWPDRRSSSSEIDFMEILDPTRQTVTGVLHFEKREPRGTLHTEIAVDATQWHSWAVEWSPLGVEFYLDGARWFEAHEHIPSIPMVLCVQLDNFGGDISQGGQMMVDWVRQYAFTQPHGIGSA